MVQTPTKPAPSRSPLDSGNHSLVGDARVPWPATARISGDHAMAVAALLGSGLLHLGLTPLDASHGAAHGISLAAAGAAQTLVALALWKRPRTTLLAAAVFLSAASITVWLLSALVADPFGHGDVDVGVGVVATKLFELLALTAAFSALTRLSAERRPAVLARHRALGAVALALVAGSALYVGASALERSDLEARAETPVIGSAARSTGDRRGQTTSGTQLVADQPGDRLALVVAGIATPFENGTAVPVAGDLSAVVTVRPTAVRFSRDIEVNLVRAGQPVDGASVKASGQMRFMDHGSFKQVAAATGDGRYLVLARFTMPGEWQLDLDVQAGSQHGSILLDLDLFE